MNNFLWALTFLTVVPIDREGRIQPDACGSVVVWFPVVGFCIGIFLSMIYFAVSCLFPPLVACALVILASVIVTGALHLDGFADTCDGIWGGWNKDKRLEIMRDSRIGSFGAIGLICLLGFKYVALLSIGEIYVSDKSPFTALVRGVCCFGSHGLGSAYIALLIMPVVGRWAQVCAAGLSAYARNEAGTGRFVLDNTSVKQVVCTAFLPVLLLWLFCSLRGLVVFAIILIFTLGWIWYIKKKIGGMTGDTLGATNEIAEMLFLLSLLLVY